MNEPEPEQTIRRAGRPRSEKSHQAILEATLALFAEEGLAGSSIEAIAERAGVGKTTIYRRWSSKEDVIKDAFNLFRADYPLPDTGNIGNDLLDMANEAQELVHRNPLMGKLTTKLIAEIKTKPEIYRVFYEKLVTPRIQQFRQIVERAQERGELRPDLDAMFILSLIFISLVYGNIFTELIDPYAKQVYQPEAAVDALLRGIVTTYDDAIAILKDPRFIKDTQKVSKPSDGQDAARESASVLQRFLTWRRDMLTVDPPEHTRLRGLVSKAFTPRMIEQLRPRVQQIADELLDAVQAQGQMDLIADFAFPLPITVISEMLGIPVKDRQQFRAWSQTIVNAPVGPQIEDKLAALEMFVQYIKTLLADKRAHPGSDLTSGLVQAEEHRDTLSETELISTIFLLIVAGHETTVNLIGNGVLALLQHPDQMQLLRADSSLLPSAIEELLRYTAPVSLSSPRWASEDIPMYGKVISKGEMVFVSLIGADTDPQQFADPEVLNILRQEHQHVAFGKGIHYCLGAPLARLEGQIAIGTLLQRLPNLRQEPPTAQLTWTQNPILRGLTSLPVTF